MTQEDKSHSIDWDSVLKDELPTLRRLVGARVTAPDRVDDILQDVALAVNERPENRPTEVASVGPWLRSVAIRKAQDFWRKHYREKSALENFETDTQTTRSPADWVMSMEDTKIISQTFQRLKQEDRELLRLKYDERLSYEEISKQLKIKAKSVEYRLARARKNFQQTIKQITAGG